MSNIDQPQGDLARTINHEPNRDWPDEMAIVATWHTRTRGGRVSRRTARVTITREEYFGLRGAPMRGDQLLHMLEQLRKVKPVERSNVGGKR